MTLRSATKRLVQRFRAQSPALITLSFGAWDLLPSDTKTVVVCHPLWRGVRAAAYASRAPVVESPDFSCHARELVRELVDHEVPGLVVHGFPPGSDSLLELGKKAGLWTGVILHSSPTQHGGEPWEGAVADNVLALAENGTINRVGFVKAGVAQAFARLGYPAFHVPNRSPSIPEVEKTNLGPGTHIGVFAEPIFRKNLVPQILAASLVDHAVIHLLSAPNVRYLRRLSIVEHSVLGPEGFHPLLASMDINLQVTLSECHPMTPVESYLHGVPCLISATSELFLSDSRLAELTVVREHDNPEAIAASLLCLLENADLAVSSAQKWIADSDERALQAWNEFVSPREGEG